MSVSFFLIFCPLIVNTDLILQPLNNRLIFLLKLGFVFHYFICVTFLCSSLQGIQICMGYFMLIFKVCYFTWNATSNMWTIYALSKIKMYKKQQIWFCFNDKMKMGYKIAAEESDSFNKKYTITKYQVSQKIVNPIVGWYQVHCTNYCTVDIYIYIYTHWNTEDKYYIPMDIICMQNQAKELENHSLIHIMLTSTLLLLCEI